MRSNRVLRTSMAIAAILILSLLAACSSAQAPSGQATPAALRNDVASASQGVPSLVVQAERVPPPGVPAPITRKEPALVKVSLETREVKGQMDNGKEFTYWTFNGTVPGPMIRVREGDTVELTLKNAPDSSNPHSIDLHAVTGPGGGAKATQVTHGKEGTFQFKALNPGLYVYHCATAPVPYHIGMGMYGLILVEPKGGMSKADREFYVMQGDFYAQPSTSNPNSMQMDFDKLMAEQPTYVVFNGAVGTLTGDNALKAKVGDRVRIFFGDGGPNLISSFHVIGEIFDTVYPEGASEPLHNVQTTLVPAGGATIVEFITQVPGTYSLVDHSISRLMKGAAAQLVVEGADNPNIFSPVTK